MKIRWTRMLLAAMGVFLACSAQADDQLRYSGLEQRLAALEAQVASQQGIQTASYDDAMAVAPADASSCSSCGCADTACNGFCFSPSPCCCDGGAYASFEFLWLRPHVNEDWVGKLSESMKLSTRTVVGYENCCGLGARVRFWNYDHTIRLLDPGAMGMEYDVLDLEATNRICFRSTDIMFGGGFRYAYVKLSDGDFTPVDIDAYGLTAAVDARTPLCTYCNNRVSWVYGARWSILGGDWEGDNDIIDTIGGTNTVRDDNLLVTELYTGVEYLFCYGGCDFFSRGTVEMQNWRSDVLGEPGIGNGIAPLSVGSTNAIGFVGLGYTIGMMF
jgi:hypothetical protein